MIVLQYGQCGNQLGSQYYSTLYDDIVKCKNFSLSQELKYNWFTDVSEGKLLARAVPIDSEPLVLSGLKFTCNSGWAYSRKCVVNCSFKGSGNNWALGYYENGAAAVENVCENVRYLMEECDKSQGFLSLHSIAGGTGSGVSSYIVEYLKDDYPKSLMLGCSILPSLTGDICVQSYNAVLALASFKEMYDAQFLFSNDCILTLCNKSLAIKSPCMKDANRIISEQLHSSLNTGNLSENISLLHCDSDRCFLSVRSAPMIPVTSRMFECPVSWQHLIKKLDGSGRGSKFHSALLTFRGVGYPQSVKLPVHNPPNFELVGREAKLFDHDKFSSIITNGTIPIPSIEKLFENSWKLFIHKAFIHQFYKYGLSEKKFLESALEIDKILKSYCAL